MSNEFKAPSRPWSDADVAHLTRNAHLLDDDTRAELGLSPIPVEEPTPSAESTETVDTPEETATETTTEVTEEKTQVDPELQASADDADAANAELASQEETVENLDANNA